MVIPSEIDKESLKVVVSKLLELAHDFDLPAKYEIACSLLEDALKLVPDSGNNGSTEIMWNMKSCLGGMRNMMLHNFLDTWLMAAPCDVKLGYYRHEFQQLQLNRWVQYVRGTGPDISGLLKDAKYVFITWDLSRLGSDDWNEQAIEQVGEMLLPLGHQTQNGLTVHRIIFVNLKSLQDQVLTRRKLFLNIWYKYFYRFCAEGNEHYCVSFIDKDAFITALGIDKSRRLDVALFSKSDKVLEKVHEEVIPTVNEEVCLGYDAAQYTARTSMARYPQEFDRVESPEGFLNLYVSEANPGDSSCIANHIVTSWVKETKGLFKKWNATSKPGLCDKDIRDNLSKVFADELGSEDVVPDIGNKVSPTTMVKLHELSQEDKNTYEQGIKFKPLLKNNKR